MNKVRVLHLLNAGIGIAIGLYCLFWARDAADALGIAFVHPTGSTDFRATYGGITLACGVFFALAFFRRVDNTAGLWFSVLFYAGLGFVRIAGILTEGPQKPMMYAFAGIEISFFLFSVYFLRGHSGSTKAIR